MSLFFRTSSLRRGTVKLKSQLDTFRGFTNEPIYPQSDSERIAYCAKTVVALENAISLIQEAKNELVDILVSVEQDYAELKKPEKSGFLEEFQQAAKEIMYENALTECDAMLCALRTRLAEIKYEHDLAGKNTYEDIGKKTSEIDQSHLIDQEFQELTHKHQVDESGNPAYFAETLQHPDDNTDRLITVDTVGPTSGATGPFRDTLQNSRSSIKPPQVSIPRFAGNAEDFQEYWAIFQTLVHENPSLSDMEKIILLKESLVGKAATTIKGIKLVPQNYSWMIDTLRKKYENITTARANIIYRLSSLRPATDNTGEEVFDELRSLVNEMVSSGYNVIDTDDPMWIEAILQKLPTSIVEEFLRENRDKDSFTVGETLDHLETLIIRYKYINRRLQARKDERGDLAASHAPQKGNVITGRNMMCYFCGRNNHRTFQCRTVHDPSERRRIVMEQNLCWKCFSKDHWSSECSRPNCSLCGKLHDYSLCFKKNAEVMPQKHTNEREQTPKIPAKAQANTGSRNGPQYNTARAPKAINAFSPMSDSSLSSNTNVTDPDQIVLMTAEGSVWNHNTTSYEKALFFFDTGAQLSLIEETAAEHLALPVVASDKCTLSGISGISETFVSHHVQVKILTAHGRELQMTMQTKPTLTKGFPAVRLMETDIEFMEENSIQLANTRLKGEHQVPQILVGIDLYNVFIPESTPPVQLPTGLRVTKTVFGFAAYGRGNMGAPLHDGENDHKECNTVITGNMTDADLIKAMFELEGLGISTKEGLDEEATYAYLSKYARSIRYENNHVIAPFPLKENIAELTDNRNMAMKRLIAQVKHLDTHEEQKRWYTKIIEQYLQDDVIEEVTKPVSNSVGTYYMPHSGVWKENKTTPLRIVFDASSKQRGRLSLNDVLYTGATFINKIHDILVASREMPIILIADIQAAFTQIRIQENHRDLCRFLWLRDPDKPPFHNNIVEYRWKRVPFGTTASPSMLNMVISAYLNRDGTELAREIQRYLYVDNVLLTALTPESAIQKYKQSKELFTKIGMNLRAFVCNSIKVYSEIAEIDRAPYGPMKLLGLEYNPASDQFTFRIELESCPATKRDVLRQHHAIYDPIGFGAPLLIKQKHLMRLVLENSPEWNSKVDPDLLRQWQAVSKGIDNVNIQIPRHIMVSNTDILRNTLWIFADASVQAMAVCAYMVDRNFTEVSGLISGKTKLAPKKRELSTPKLELLALLLALRLAESISLALKNGIAQICIVSDSLIALSWIHTSRKLPLFVTNQRDRIKTIMNRLSALGHEIQLLHVPGEQNPADDGTRGLTGEQLRSSDWVTGPQWLLTEDKRKMLTKIDLIGSISTDSLDNEEDGVVLAEASSPQNDTYHNTIPLERFSSLYKALRVTALVGKFIRMLANRAKNSTHAKITLFTTALFSTGQLITASDIKIAECILLQSQHRSVDVNEIQRKNRDKHIFRDENGIIRVHSRLQNANLPYDTRYPIYIQPHSELMRLIITDLHKSNGHCGKNHLLTLARQRFWLPKPSRAIRQLLKKCAICQREQSLPFNTPPMAQLPPDRVKRAKPFENIGCYFLGPYSLKDGSKAYVCLYTCLTTRAVHLELVENLSGEAFLNSFVRFTARRGVPRIVRTDCGTNFVLGQKVIDALFDQTQSNGMSTMSFCAQERITWLFNPPGAPWMGGVWERLVASVKSAYQKCVRRNKLSFVEMNTVLTRIEAILNTRPLTAISTNETDTLPLRPVDFLQGNLCFSLPAVDEIRNDDSTYSPDCIQTVSQAKEALEFSERIADRFWRIWNTEYLTMLREVHKRLFKQHRHNARPVPEEGEIVLIEHELIPRGHWAIGKIEELVHSSDGVVRTAVVKLPHRNTTIQRPINKLYPLEIKSIPANAKLERQENHDSNSNKTADAASTLTSPRQSVQKEARAAKTKASEAIRAHYAEQDDEECFPTTQLVARAYSRHNTHTIQLLLTLIFLGCCTADYMERQIHCRDGVVTIDTQHTEFELCFDNNCRNISRRELKTQFKLPPSPIHASTQIRIQTYDSIETRTCQPAPFCDQVSNLLTKALIGNPQCWPSGAMLSVAILTYLTITVILFLIWVTRHRKEKRTPPATNSISLSVIQHHSCQDQVPFTLASFKPALLPPALAISLLLGTMLIPGNHSCQDGYMRHSTELSCNQRSECRYQFRHELIFNRVTHQLCIVLRHANTSVGFIKVRRQPVRLECVKDSLFWTRETEHKVRFATRCRGMGSCTNDVCETLNPYVAIPEFNNTPSYPGYTACSIACSGINCLCAIPFRACMFYRVDHIPVSEQPLEVITCSHWQASVILQISAQIYNFKHQQEVTLLPYSSQKVGNFSLSLTSIQNPHLRLSQKYVLGKNATFTLPENFLLPIECASRQQAEHNFSSCRSTHFCNCDVSGLMPNCRCPYNELSSLRKHKQHFLPISTPYTTIDRSGHTVIAETLESETTVVISSQQNLDGAHLNVDAPCTIHTGKLKGCYSCPHGSQIDISCYSPVSSWTTIVCAHHIFSIECNPSNRTSTVKIAFDKAVVSSHCFTICGNKNISVEFSGILYYHASESIEDIFLADASQTIPQTDWFKELRLPDLFPLWIIAIKHWKITLAIISTLAVALLLTYLFGPLIILTLFKITTQLAVLLVKLIFQTIYLLGKVLLECARGVHRLRTPQQ